MIHFNINDNYKHNFFNKAKSSQPFLDYDPIFFCNTLNVFETGCSNLNLNVEKLKFAIRLENTTNISTFFIPFYFLNFKWNGSLSLDNLTLLLSITKQKFVLRLMFDFGINISPKFFNSQNGLTLL